MATRLHRVLAGEDGPGIRALPAGELLHPLPLGALAVLIANDHWLKGAGLVPASVTGKLSDFAGLLFFPLLLTAATDVLLMAAARWLSLPVDFSLRRSKLVLACVATAGVFSAVKLSPAAAAAVADILSIPGFPATIVADATDLAALPMVAVAYALGAAEIRRVPLGRLEVIERGWDRGRHDVRPQLADIGAGDRVDALAAGLVAFFETGDVTAAREALRSIRAPTAARACPPS